MPVQMKHTEVFTPRTILGINKRLMKRPVSQQFTRATPVFVLFIIYDRIVGETFNRPVLSPTML